MKKQLINFYLEFINDFLTADRFAEYHGLTRAETINLLSVGKKYYNESIEKK